MHKLYVLTNNDRVISALEGDSDIHLVREISLETLLTRAMDYINKGYHLATDALAGYLSRYNPYHTILLISPETAGTDTFLRDLSSIDILLSRYWLHRAEYLQNGDSSHKRADHAAIDQSIALNAVTILKTGHS